MGAFFTNIQVYVAGQSPEAIRGQIAEALRQWADNLSSTYCPSVNGTTSPTAPW